MLQTARVRGLDGLELLVLLDLGLHYPRKITRIYHAWKPYAVHQPLLDAAWHSKHREILILQKFVFVYSNMQSH